MRKPKDGGFKVRPLTEAELQRAREAAERLDTVREEIRRECGTFDVAAMIRQIRDEAEAGFDEEER